MQQSSRLPHLLGTGDREDADICEGLDRNRALAAAQTLLQHFIEVWGLHDCAQTACGKKALISIR